MSTDRHDGWIYAALEPARRLEPSGVEVAGAVARVRPRADRMPVARRTVVLALLGAAILAAGAGAATGLLQIGSVFEDQGFTGAAHREVVKETLLAKGTTPGAGRWRISTFETRRGVRCLKLSLPDSRAHSVPGPRSSGYCGAVAGFSAFTHGRSAAAAKHGRLLLFGRAPGGAREVELTADGGQTITARTQSGAHDISGSHWFLPAPPRLDHPTLRWIDAAGHRRGGIDLSSRFAGPMRPTVVLSGHTPRVGRWQVKASESRRHKNEGDIYEPEGLPCMTIFFADPKRKGKFLPHSGGCGEFPKTPGFAKYQTAFRGLTRTRRPKALLMFGRAPVRADAVQLLVHGKPTKAVATEPPPPSGPRTDYWFMAIPPDYPDDSRVRWIDRDRPSAGGSIGVFPL
jgi:hypothetical protein